MQYKILVVDDEMANLRLLERLFRGTYEVITAGSGEEAIHQLLLHDIALIISDQRMPGISGIELLKRSAELRPQTVRIMLTGYSDAEALVEAVNSGVVYKYLTKPWVNEELLQTTKRALQHYETLRAQRQLQANYERMQIRLSSLKQLALAVSGSVYDSIDPGISTRASVVRENAVRIARKFDVDSVDLELLGNAAYLAVLKFYSSQKKTGIKNSLDIISHSPEFEEIFDLAEHIWENFDGTGSPNALHGEEIPLPARIIAVILEFERAKDRFAVKDDTTDSNALEQLRWLAGTRLDPAIVDALCEQDHIWGGQTSSTQSAESYVP
ncbi:response regulator [Leptolyngbya sp. 7M]|uniref:response regulator n=1 Tax=Leptolyngbya sp. 7M TaxID=2812896 RepID=UPI001B8B0216|nr:response regulator [Leptolyngbya sp. 7M]QYO66141.1 response regulator [Leptolyngbya sp. 7M]